MYYRYDDKSVLIEKSSEPLAGDNVCLYDGDLDIELYKYIAGLLDENGYMIYHTKYIRPAAELTQYINQLKSSIEINQAETELNIDYRLSLIELGLV